MNALELIDYFRTYCEENKMFFAPGESHFQNFISDQNVYDAYEMILCCDFRMSPVFNENQVEYVTYTGTLAVGRKREECTESSLDELFLQKYDNRLSDLTKILLSIIEGLVCQDEVDVDRCSIGYALNQYDVNIDFVTAQLTIRIPYVVE